MNEFFENPFETRKDDFLKSPAEVPAHRKVLLEDKDISPTRKPYGFMQSSFWVIMMVHVIVCGDL